MHRRLPSLRKTGSEKGLFSRFFPEGEETSVHRLIFQAQMGKTSISYEFHGAQFFIVKLLTSIDSQLTISRQEWKNFGSDGKWRENLNSQRKKIYFTYSVKTHTTYANFKHFSNEFQANAPKFSLHIQTVSVWFIMGEAVMFFIWKERFHSRG